MKAFVPFHQHLLVRGTMRNPIIDPLKLNLWFKSLVELVDMEILMAPWSIYVNDLGNEGITGIVCLSTSHSSLHVWDKLEEPLFQFDLYSCKQYDVDIVISWLNEMDLIEYDWMLIDRNSTLSLQKTGTNGTALSH